MNKEVSTGAGLTLLSSLSPSKVDGVSSAAVRCYIKTFCGSLVDRKTCLPLANAHYRGKYDYVATSEFARWSGCGPDTSIHRGSLSRVDKDACLGSFES
jgi:hypothetical protein